MDLERRLQYLEASLAKLLAAQPGHALEGYRLITEASQKLWDDWSKKTNTEA